MSKTLYIDRSEGGIIIRRQGTSFFCCCDTEEPACCMYPPHDLEIEYNFEDLPLTLFLDLSHLEGDGFRGTAVMTRVGSYELFSQYTGAGIEIFLEGSWQPFEATIHHDGGGGSWYLVFYETGFGATSYGTCLVANDVTDQFEDTYTVGEVTLTRQSLCKWTGTGFTLVMTGIKWTLNGTSKTSGNQSTPTGTYTAGTVS